MNNHKKQTLAIVLGFALFGGMANLVLGMEPEEPTREELGDTEAVDIWTNASNEEKDTLFNNATPEQKRLILAKTFTKVWLELNKMKKDILKLTGEDEQGNEIFQMVYDAIINGTLNENMKMLVSKYWANVFDQYKETIAPPISLADYWVMLGNINTPLGQVASAYNRKLVPLLETIVRIVNGMK